MGRGGIEGYLCVCSTRSFVHTVHYWKTTCCSVGSMGVVLSPLQPESVDVSGPGGSGSTWVIGLPDVRVLDGEVGGFESRINDHEQIP